MSQKHDASFARMMKLYRFIIKFKQINDGRSPSIRQMVDGTDITSTSVAQWYLDKMVELSLIERMSGTRGIRIIGGKWIYTAPKNLDTLDPRQKELFDV